jgi:hypothetical protein
MYAPFYLFALLYLTAYWVAIGLLMTGRVFHRGCAVRWLFVLVVSQAGRKEQKKKEVKVEVIDGLRNGNWEVQKGWSGGR